MRIIGITRNSRGSHFSYAVLRASTEGKARAKSLPRLNLARHVVDKCTLLLYFAELGSCVKSGAAETERDSRRFWLVLVKVHTTITL